MAFDVSTHILVPLQTKLTDGEKEKLLESYDITLKQLPKILKDDPSLVKLNVEIGDVIKIQRKSKTAGVAVYYRLVVES